MAQLHIDPEIAAVRKLHNAQSSTNHSNLNIHEWFASQAGIILNAHQQGNRTVLFHLRCWSPDYVSADPARIMSSELTLEQAQETIAREYGYNDWQEIEALGSTTLA